MIKICFVVKILSENVGFFALQIDTEKSHCGENSAKEKMW